VGENKLLYEAYYSTAGSSTPPSTTTPTTEVVQPEPPPKKNLIVAVTGHRPDKLGGYNTPNPMYSLVVKGLADAFEKLKPDFIITGMALGTDQWAAEIAFNMGIPFVAAIPFDGFHMKWIPSSQAKYHWLLSVAYQKVTVSQGGYEPAKMQIRNQWMIDSCNQVIAVFNGTSGGTANCLGYAALRGKPVHYIQLPPAGMEVEEFYEKMLEGKVPEQKTVEAPKPGTGRIVEI
jgi:uncharacterized phage-like protein YoqJ